MTLVWGHAEKCHSTLHHKHEHAGLQPWVPVATVALHGHERNLRNPWGEDAHRPLALDAELPLLQLRDDRLDHGVVVRLAPLLGDMFLVFTTLL